MWDGFNLEQFLQSVQNMDTVWIYGILFLAGYLENCVPPIPGDTVTVFAAYMVGTGRLNYFLVFLTATLGNLSGFMTMYQIGKYFGRDFFLKKNWKFFPREGFEKAETWFNKYGYKVILFNRFLSGLRSVISLFAGMTHLDRRRLLPLAFLSACMWDGVLIYGGYLVGDNWKYFDEIMEQYHWYVMTGLGLLAALFLTWKMIGWIRNRKKTK